MNNYNIISIEQRKQTLKELQTNQTPYITVELTTKPLTFTVRYFYGFTECSCGESGCTHVGYINAFLIRDLRLLRLIDNRHDISLYNLTKGCIEDNVKLLIENCVGEPEYDCPICLGPGSKVHVKCSKCVEKYHVSCIEKYNKDSCPVCRSPLFMMVATL